MIHNPVPSLLVALLAAGALVGCGSDTTVTETSGESQPADAAACEDGLDALIEQLKVDVAYDYEPSSSPAELAAIVDAVVIATLGEVGQEGEKVQAVLENPEVVSGDASLGPDGDITIEWYVAPQPREISRVDGISVLVFLAHGDRSIPTPEIEGLWFACGSDAPARSMIVEPVRSGWPAGVDATLDNLALAITDP